MFINCQRDKSRQTATDQSIIQSEEPNGCRLTAMRPYEAIPIDRSSIDYLPARGIAILPILFSFFAFFFFNL